MDWSCVVYLWIIVFNFYQPSFWRHPFTADDPLVSKWCNATFLQISSDVSGFCHFGLVLFMVLWQSPDTPVMSCFHVSVRLWARSCRALSRLHALFHVGAWCSDPGTLVLSFGFVSGLGHSRSTFCLIVWVCGLEFARPHALLSTCVLWCCTQFVFLSAACIHVISCAVWHAAFVFISCVLSCCHVLCEHVAYEFSH